MIDNKLELSHFEALYPDRTRFEEVKRILEMIKAGKSCEVIALPGVGRSNFLGLLSYNKNVKQLHLKENSHWFHFVFMDFSEVKKRSPYDVVKFMLISLAYSLSERKLKEEYDMVNSFIKESIEFQDELILFQALKKSIDYLAIEKELTIVLLFDRFEQYIPFVTESFFSNLRVLRNRAKYRFSTVFSLNRPFEEILEPEIFSEFYEFVAGNTIYLPLKDSDGLEFRFEYIERITEKKLKKELKELVLELSGGHGKIAKVAYEAALANNVILGSNATPESDPGQARMTHEEFIPFLLEQHAMKSALYEIWNSLAPAEQHLLVILANEVRPESAKERSWTSQDDVTKTYLEQVGLVKDEQITIPIFAEYVKQKPMQSEEHITYNEDSHEIVKGSISITDKLSPSEFRLLRFLIQNKDRICEKDEIITAVWKDSKTQEGVTDQALDQIMYRLRKKIEEDPNNPRHIQTIKGRGFRFTP